MTTTEKLKTESVADETGSNTRTKVGKVISDKMDKTIVVAVERSVKHPTYGKIMRKITKLHVHDEYKKAKEGDIVRIIETRPKSKLKTWGLVEVMS